jgi:hypothetical protein
VDNGNNGGEPGIYLHPTEDYVTLDIDLTSKNFGSSYDDFVKEMFVAPSWVSDFIDRDETMKAVRGFKFEPKMQKGGYGAIYLRMFEMYDADGNLIKDYIDPNAASIRTIAAPARGLTLSGKTLRYSGLSQKACLTAFDLNGNRVITMSLSGSGEIPLENLFHTKGAYIVRLTDKSFEKTLQDNI